MSHPRKNRAAHGCYQTLKYAPERWHNLRRVCSQPLCGPTVPSRSLKGVVLSSCKNAVSTAAQHENNHILKQSKCQRRKEGGRGDSQVFTDTRTLSGTQLPAGAMKNSMFHSKTGREQEVQPGGPIVLEFFVLFCFFLSHLLSMCCLPQIPTMFHLTTSSEIEKLAIM